MRKINDKNLRREVQKQLKELRGRVSQMAVDHGLMVNDEGLKVNGEGQSLNPHLSTFNSRNSNFDLRPQHSLNSHLSTFNSRNSNFDLRPQHSLNSHLSTFKVCANERESSSLECSQRVQPKLNDQVIKVCANERESSSLECSQRVQSKLNDQVIKVCANERESSSLEYSQRVQPKLNDLVINSKRPSLPELERFIRRDYDLRYNVLTEQTEYRRRDDVSGEFHPATQRVYRTWLTDLQREGVEFWKVDGLRTAIESMHIEDYHPVAHYFGTLPEWDGKDRITPLMRRLTQDEVMVGYLCRWLLAFVAQAQGREGALYANSVAPILISEQQGWHKSTFCRLLLPPELRMFYTDNFNLTAESQCERRLTDSLLINLDEYDRYSARKQSTLKNLMQMPSLRVRKAYARNATTLPRIASFIGTSNTPHLLTDTTGSRRFLCVELTEMIDVDTPIAYEQLYAQCIHLLNGGERHHFTAEEVADIEQRNRAYRHIPPVEEYCMKYFRQPQEGETPLLLSAAEIYEELRQRHPRLMRGVNEQNFGALLREWGFERVEHRHRRVYRMMRVEG